MDFKALFENRHEYAKAWKAKTGGKVLGWFEPYFPEEVAYAAGVLPVRIMAKQFPDDVSDKWIYASCYPVRNMVNQFLTGHYDYIDGLVNTEGCQWMYNAWEVAVNNNPGLFNHYLFMPDHTDAPTSKTVLRSELDVYALPLPDKVQIDGKYNEFIPLELLRKQFIEDYLDFEGLQRDIVKQEKG